MSGTAHRLRLRLFIEGVEVPVIGATVQASPNSPAAASIQIPPMPNGTKLLPRSLVHLFFLDFYESRSSSISVTGAGPAPEDTSRFDALNLVHGEKLTALARKQEAKARAEAETTIGGGVGDSVPGVSSQYKLLFGGEVVGFQYTKNVRQRSLVLQCLDWSNYWDYAYQWNNTDLFGPGLKAIFSGGATNLFTDFLEDEGQAIIKIIQSPSVQFPNLKGLLGGIIHLIEGIGGSYYTGKTFAGENIFFSLAELRLHITQMITAYEKDPTSKRLLNADGYDGLFGRTLGGLGQQVSIRQAINALMGIIFHETYPIPTPLFVPGTTAGPSGKSQRFARNDPNFSYIATTADGLLTAITELRSSLNGEASTFKSATPRTSLVQRLTVMQKTCKDTANRIKDKDVASARALYSTASKLLGNALAKAQKWVPGAKDPVLQALDRALQDAATQLQKAADLYVVSSASGAKPARLNQQIFRPDVWFSAPPRCNVLFPDSYNTLTYARAFLSEPTRLLLKTNDEFFGEDELFDNFYVTPRSTTLKGNKKLGLTELFSSDILDHELFTGILPVFEKMGELNIFGARSGTVKGRNPKIGLAQRTTNFLYFKYRFAARTMQVGAKFNPYLVPGFPGLIIDKHVDAASVEERQRLILQAGGSTPEIDELLGTHFLANFTEVMHTVDQQQGRTDISCSYARQPEESIEFLGAIERDQTIRKRFDKDASRVTVVATLNPPRLQSLGPSGGNITGVQEVTDAYRSQDIASGRKIPYYGGPTRSGTATARVQVPVGVLAPASAYGSDVTRLIGRADQPVTFRAFRVTEDVPRYRKQIVDLPAEEYIRPGWYGDCWHPSLIGQVYADFFRTGAITDEQQITTDDGGSIGAPFEQAEQALAAAQGALDQGNYLAVGPGLIALDQDSSVQSAVNFLVQTYSTIRTGGFDPEEFIRAYTWRPIASMNDMFGSQDLQFSEDGQRVVQGIEGFHSRAFGDYENLFGLVTPNIENILGLKQGSPGASRGDTRRRKQQAVKDYVSALNFSRAILG